MLRTGLFGTGALMLVIGIALAIYGYNLQPNAGEAIGNIFSGDFTDKRNLFIYAGIGIAVLGGVSLAGGAFTGNERLRRA